MRKLVLLDPTGWTWQILCRPLSSQRTSSGTHVVLHVGRRLSISPIWAPRVSVSMRAPAGSPCKSPPKLGFCLVAARPKEIGYQLDQSLDV